ncbi:MAG: hypothetical protein AB7D28_09960 [Candidatus Berkiella sp.]
MLGPKQGETLSQESRPEEIKIHLGFMPEEVASVLKPIINTRMGTDAAVSTMDTGESILIISRGKITDELFEQFVSNFGIEQYAENASTLTAKSDAEGICERIAHSLAGYIQGADITATEIVGAKYKMRDFMHDGKPELSVARIGTGPITQICLQLPEMGLQGDLAAVYTMGMMDAIGKHALDPTTPVTISSYGGGGSASEQLTPGQLNNCSAVLSLRTHIDLLPQVKNLIAALNARSGIDTTDEIAQLQRIQTEIETQSTSYNHNHTQNNLIKIRNQLLAKGFTEQEIKNTEEKDKRYYTEISLADPKGGKRTFLRTASYDAREKAEEVAHLVLLDFANTKDPLLTSSYVTYLKKTNPEYAELQKNLDPNNIIEKTLTQIESIAHQQDSLSEAINEKKRAHTSFVRAKLKASLYENNQLSLTASGNLPTSTQSTDDLSKKIAELDQEIAALKAEEEALDRTATELSVTLETSLENDAIRKKIQAIHEEEIAKLKEQAHECYWDIGGAHVMNMRKYDAFRDGTNPGFDRTKDYLIQAMHRTHDNSEIPSINFAAGMFIGAQTKEAVSRIAGSDTSIVADVNMEDDVIAEIIHMTVTGDIGKRDGQAIALNQFAMARVHCDPFSITHQVEDEFKAWCKQKTADKNYYTSAILWGLSGFDPKNLSNDAQWTFVDHLKAIDDSPENAALFYQYEGVVVDPFWREIGTDFLASIMNKSAFAIDTKDPSNAETIAGLAKEAAHIKQMMRDNADPQEIKARAELLVFHFLNVNNMINIDGSYKVWARAGSWCGNPERSIDQIGFVGAAIDRGFYVSSNMNALIEHGKRIAEKQTETMSVPQESIVLYEGPRDPNEAPQLTLQQRRDAHLASLLEGREKLRAARLAGEQHSSAPEKESAKTLGSEEPKSAPPRVSRGSVMLFYNEKKITGPRALTEIQKIEDPAQRMKAADEFIKWARAHNRHFNPPAMKEIKKISQGQDQADPTLERSKPKSAR